MKKIIKIYNKRIVRFLTSGMKIGIVSASSTQEMKLRRHSRASGLTFLNTVPLAASSGRLAVAGAFRCYSSSNITTNPNIHNVIPVAYYPNADTQKSVILKENEGENRNI